jgi:hypothetical protein
VWRLASPLSGISQIPFLNEDDLYPMSSCLTMVCRQTIQETVLCTPINDSPDRKAIVGCEEHPTALSSAAARTRTIGILSAGPWASRRREDLLQLLDGLNPTIAQLTQAIEREAEKSRKRGC